MPRRAACYSQSAGRRAPMLSREARFAAPHHPKAAEQVCRAAHLLPSSGCPQATSQSNGGRGLPAVRGALVHRCKARRLTRAWSCRRPVLGSNSVCAPADSVLLSLCGAPTGVGAAA